LIDISGQLLAASKSRHAEDPETARLAAKALDARLSWEPCERWATLVLDRVLAQVHVLSPLVLCLDVVQPVLVEALGSEAIVVTVHAMDEVELCASEAALTTLFEQDFSAGTDLVPEHFAASDLWFSTVT
jgi:hypothetical protein